MNIKIIVSIFFFFVEHQFVLAVKKRYKFVLTSLLQTNKIRHLDKTLYLHLCGTHRILEDWDNPDFVCTAGLFHSIYGTQIFQRAAISTSRRAWLRWLIGSKAETLAYLFCVINRSAEFRRNRGSDEISVLDTTTGETIILDRHSFVSLQEMEVANLLEQGCKKERITPFVDIELSTKAKAAIWKATEQPGEYVHYVKPLHD